MQQQLAFLHLVVQKWKSSSSQNENIAGKLIFRELAGKGIWWRKAQDGSGYIFFDGKDKPDYHCEGPQLLHFRNATILVTGDHETEVTRPNVLQDVSNIEHQTVATEPGTHHDAPDTS